MTTRITERDLQQAIRELNAVTGSPEHPFSGGHWNIGNHHLSFAYGGVSLHRVTNASGGVEAPLGAGHRPKRELYSELRAYITGLERSK